MGIQTDRIKELRKAKGWNQTQLAEQAGIAQGTLSRIERGESVSSQAATIGALEKALGVPPGSLMDATIEVRVEPHADAAPINGAREEYDEVEREVLANTPEGSLPTVRAALDKIRRSGSMQSLDIPLTPASLEEMVRVVSRHSRRRNR